MHELHFRLIIHDAGAVDQLHLVAHELIEKARRTNERAKAYACLLAYERLLAVAYVHERMQTVRAGDQNAADSMRDACVAMMDCFPVAGDDDGARRARHVLPQRERPDLPRFLQTAARAAKPETVALVMRRDDEGGWSVAPGVALTAEALEMRPWLRDLLARMRAACGGVLKAFGFAGAATTS